MARVFYSFDYDYDRLVDCAGAEGLVEQVHHHNLVKEAREDLRAEMQANHAKMAKNLAAVQSDEQRIAGNLKTLAAIRAGKKIKETSMQYQILWDLFGNSAWKTAESSGALIYLDFEAERDLADTYSMQEWVTSNILRISRDHALAASAMIASDGPEKMTAQETELCLQRSADLLMDLKTLEQLLVQLDQQYQRELAKFSAS